MRTIKWLVLDHRVGKVLELGFKFLPAWLPRLCLPCHFTFHCQHTQVPLGVACSQEPEWLAECYLCFSSSLRAPLTKHQPCGSHLGYTGNMQVLYQIPVPACTPCWLGQNLWNWGTGNNGCKAPRWWRCATKVKDHCTAHLAFSWWCSCG